MWSLLYLETGLGCGVCVGVCGCVGGCGCGCESRTILVRVNFTCM